MAAGKLNRPDAWSMYSTWLVTLKTQQRFDGLIFQLVGPYRRRQSKYDQAGCSQHVDLHLTWRGAQDISPDPKHKLTVLSLATTSTAVIVQACKIQDVVAITSKRKPAFNNEPRALSVSTIVTRLCYVVHPRSDISSIFTKAPFLSRKHRTQSPRHK